MTPIAWSRAVLRRAAPFLALLLASCEPDPEPQKPIDPGVAALSIPNRFLGDIDLHMQAVPAGRPVQVFVADQAAVLTALRGEGAFSGQRIVEGTIASGPTTRFDYVIPAELRDQPRMIVAAVVLDPSDPAYDSFDLNGRTLAELGAAMAAKKIAVGIAYERSMFEPTTVLAGGRAYPFILTSVLPLIPPSREGWWDTSTGPAPHPEEATTVRRQNGETVTLPGGYRLLNNQWNLKQLLGRISTSVYTKEDGSFGWQWSCDGAHAVIAYPSVLYGGWLNHGGSSPGLPFRVGAQRIRADFSIATSATGVYDTAFDLWATPSNDFRTLDDAVEVMIWNDRKGMLFYPAGRITGQVEIGGVRWDVYVNRDHRSFTQDSWTFVAFLPDRPVMNGPLDLSAFFDHLVETEILPSSYWVVSLELGTEVVVGTGATEVSGYAITLTDPP
jgi:hypothetical protein